MAVLVSDSFNRANSTTTLGSTDSYAGGSTYTWAKIGSAVWGISSNQAYTSTGANDSPAYVDMTTQADNVRISVDIIVSSGIYLNGLSFRVQDTSNYFRCYANNGSIKIDRMLSGSSTTIANTALTGVSVPFTISVELSGSTINYLVNGVQKGTLTDTNLTAATKHGIYIGNNTTITLDNFKIESLATGTTQTGASSVQGVSTITADATVIGAITGSASLQGVATLAATATVLNAPMLGSAALQGISTLTATGNKVQTGGASLTGVATSTVFAQGLTVLGGASLSGVGVLTASGVSGASIARAISLFGSLPSPIALLGESVAAIHLQGSWTSTVSLLGSNPEPIALEGGLMTKTKQDFTMYAGDTPPLSFTMADSTSLSGATVKWSLRKGNVKGTQVLLKTTSSGLSVSGTVATISLLNADTLSLEGQYYHEAEITDVSGNVSTVMTGTVTITPSGV